MVAFINIPKLTPIAGVFGTLTGTPIASPIEWTDQLRNWVVFDLEFEKFSWIQILISSISWGKVGWMRLEKDYRVYLEREKLYKYMPIYSSLEFSC